VLMKKAVWTWLGEPRACLAGSHLETESQHPDPDVPRAAWIAEVRLVAGGASTAGVMFGDAIVTGSSR
jgi:hypothetical protein